ncbi:MAG TPA: M3 family oligoendopeptidase [Gemmatimonadaceae bacterium]|nr:M3 family oligoendopeptidase [Gemmatimonadaceae bacterium]
MTKGATLSGQGGLPVLPDSPDTFVEATWEDIAPYYDALAAVEITPAVAREWLATWSRLDAMLGEAGSLAMIAYTANTADEKAEAAHLRFAMDIYPKVDERQVRLARKLLDSGYGEAGLETTLKKFRTDAEIFREENVERFAKLEELEAGYDKIVGGLSVDWDGERKTIPQLKPYMQSRDRAERQRAFMLGADAYVAKRTELEDIFDKSYVLRHEVARAAGFPDYMRYAFAAKYRFDYTPEDCVRFHRAVEEAVVPIAARQHEYRRRRLGVDTLRPWDLAINPDSDARLRPFEDVAGFLAPAERIFTRVDPELGDNFRTLEQERLLDLESRAGKAPGGYCTTLHWRGRPFIYMNAVGVHDDVSTLVHEAGHAFHAFAAHAHPYVWQRSSGHEAAELASMSMELLAGRYLARPEGYYSVADAALAQIEHLEDVLYALPHIACVDAFQHWIYTSGKGGDRDARDAAWLEIRRRFEPSVDWSGLEPQRVARWLRQSHIFTSPFYYIEYGLAQLGALQVWRDSLRDHPAAVRRYKNALALGGTVPLPEMYRAAGVKLVFDAPTMAELVGLVEERIAHLRAELARGNVAAA